VTADPELPSRAARLARAAGRHRVFLVALLGGLAIRVVVSVAYHPALIYIDSRSYLRMADHPVLNTLRPIGYSLALWPLRQLEPVSPAPIVVLQHLLGLALAVLIYAFLVRRGLRPWGATLATLPVLLDPLELVLEHFVLSDFLFAALLVVACVLVLWEDRPRVWAVGLAGLVVGASLLVRGAGTFAPVVFVVALLCLRVGWVRLVAFAAAFVVPVAAYAVAFHSAHGEYALSRSGSQFLYARLATVVNCHDPQLRLPSYEQVLCPRQPVAQRPSSDYYMWGHKEGPAYHVVVPPGMSGPQVFKDFDKRVIRAQPGTVTKMVAGDLLRGFAPTRTHDAPGFPARNWLFDDHYWMFTYRGVLPGSEPGPASFMKHYRQVLWTPGPLLGALAIVALLATAGLGRSRRSGDRVAIGLLVGTCLVVLLTGAAVSGPSWRYQLPQLTLLPMAGALAVAALARGRAGGRPEPAPPLRLLDRAGSTVSNRVPALRPLHESGLLAVLLAVVGGLVVALVAGVLGAGSGWFRADTAAGLGAVAGILTAIALLVARRHAAAAGGRP
jgi:hypothetical protein